MSRFPTPAERRRFRRETGRLVKTSLHIGDLLTDEELEAAGRVYGPEMVRKRAAVAEIQAREAADRAERAAAEQAAVEREQAEREAEESAAELAKLLASTAAAHERIDELTAEQRAQRRRDANDGVNITRGGGR